MASATQLLEALESNQFPNTVQQRVRQYSLKDAYKTIGWVYACNNLIADCLAGVRFYFYRGNGDTFGTRRIIEPAKKREPIVTCFSPPRQGSIWTTSEMIKSQVLHMGLFGESFMIMEKKGKYPVSIRLVNPLNCAPKLTADGKDIDHWVVKEQSGSGEVKDIKYRFPDIIQWKYQNPYNPFRGLAPLSAARLAVEQDLNMATWNAGFFQNGIRNPIALLLKQSFNDQQRKNYVKRMKENFGGFSKGQIPLLVEGGVDVKVLANTLKDLDFIEGKSMTREELCAVYSVPPAQVGIFRYANYSNSKEQREILYHNTLRPKMVNYRDVFQIAILDQFFPGVKCDFHWESVEAFRDDPEVKAEVDLKTAQAAQLYFEMQYDQAQVALILGRPELNPAGTTVGMSLASENDSGDDEEDDEMDAAAGAPYFSRAKDHVVVYADEKYLRHFALKTLHTSLRPHVKRTETFFRSFYLSHKSVQAKKSTNLDDSFWVSKWEEGIGPILHDAFQEGVATVEKDLRSTLKEVSMDEDMFHTVRTELLKIAVNNKNKGIEDLARSVIHSVFNKGRFVAMEALKVTEMVWCHSGDSEHSALHGTSVLTGETFRTTSVMYPGQTMGKCTCTIFPAVMQVEEKTEKIVKKRGKMS